MHIIIDNFRIEVDLSRRALPFKLEGLSFREYLNMSHNANLSPISLEDILQGNVVWPREIGRPLPLFDEYLRRGYYPFYNSNHYLQRFDSVVLQTLEVDIPHQANLTVSTARKLKKLMSVIAQSTPFKPNYANLGRTLEMNRSTVSDIMV